MHVFVTIPALNEKDFITGVLQDLSKQEYADFTLLVCINQPDAWWDDDAKKEICINNVETMAYVQSFCELHKIKLILIDKCTKGNGWDHQRGGVGWARKVLMDHANDIADEDDIIVSLDADTRVESNYLSEIVRQFLLFPKASAIALPYFHRLQGDDEHKKSMLRYEIYLRSYAINLLRIKHPYSYTPIGSAMAARVSAYRKIRGIAATSSGEDFYFMMKLRKVGVIIPYCNTKVYPSSRKSHRVIFGTGPTVALGALGQFERYPIYQPALFNDIENACRSFGELFIANNQTAADRILKVFPDIEYEKLLQNHPQLIRFIHACYQKADAFAIYKYVKANQPVNANELKSIADLLAIFDISFNNLLDVGKDNNINSPLHIEDKTIESETPHGLHNLSVEQLKTLLACLTEIEEKFLIKLYDYYFALRNDLKNPVWKYMS